MFGSFLCWGWTGGVAGRRWVGEKAHSGAGVLHQNDSRGRLSSISFSSGGSRFWIPAFAGMTGEDDYANENDKDCTEGGRVRRSYRNPPGAADLHFREDHHTDVRC